MIIGGGSGVVSGPPAATESTKQVRTRLRIQEAEAFNELGADSSVEIRKCVMA